MATSEPRDTGPDRDRPEPRPEPTPSRDPAQRDALEHSEREAHRPHPENYQERKADDKIVSTGQADARDVGAIDAIDNDTPGGGRS